VLLTDPENWQWNSKSASDDEEFEQEGLRIYVEDALVATLDGSILDVQYASEGPELVWR